MGDKRIKQLKRQIPLKDGLRVQAYFRDMAADGKFLDEISHLYYYFREGEPKEIRYAAQVFTDYPSKAELESIAAKGWKEVCHWDKEYVFATEDPAVEDLFDHLETERLEVERRLMEVEKETKHPDWFLLVIILVSFGVGIYYNGFQMESLWSAAKEVWHWIAIFLFGIVFNFFYKRRLKKKQEELEEQRQLREEGRWDDRDTDWYRKRKRNTVMIGAVILLFGVFAYYGCNMNEKTFDMPEKISYAALPAVRVEELQEGTWERAGEPVDLSREGVGIRNGTDFQRNNEYRDLKFWSKVQNYGVTYNNLPFAEQKVYTTQYLQEQQTEELTGVETMYWNYRAEFLAKNGFGKMAEEVMDGSGMYSGAELDWVDAKREALDIPKGALDELLVCRITAKKGERLHILARMDDQLMEIKYKGAAEIESILDEINKVFVVQTK